MRKQKEEKLQDWIESVFSVLRSVISEIEEIMILEVKEKDKTIEELAGRLTKLNRQIYEGRPN